MSFMGQFLDESVDDFLKEILEKCLRLSRNFWKESSKISLKNYLKKVILVEFSEENNGDEAASDWVSS